MYGFYSVYIYVCILRTKEKIGTLTNKSKITVFSRLEFFFFCIHDGNIIF